MDQMRRLAPCCKNGSAEDSSEYTASLRAPLKRNRQSTQQEREGITATGAATQERIFFLPAAATYYGWTGQQPSSGFCDLAPSILHYNWF
jgi:hypothetical protein